MPVRYSEHSAGPSTRRAEDSEAPSPVGRFLVAILDLSKAELQAELERRGLPKTGNKDELIERLLADDE